MARGRTGLSRCCRCSLLLRWLRFAASTAAASGAMEPQARSKLRRRPCPAWPDQTQKRSSATGENLAFRPALFFFCPRLPSRSLSLAHARSVAAARRRLGGGVVADSGWGCGLVTYQEISSRRDARCSVAVASRGGCRCGRRGRELGGRVGGVREILDGKAGPRTNTAGK